MSKSFNHHHGAKPVVFKLQDPVYVLNYRLNKTFWLSGRVVGLQGLRTYKVYVPLLGATIHRHVNQMRPRTEEFNELADVKIPTSSDHEPVVNDSTPVSPGRKPDVKSPQRRPSHNTPLRKVQTQQRKSCRIPKSAQKFSPDPSKKTYR